MTDWSGIAGTIEAATAGLDLEMPAPARASGRRLSTPCVRASWTRRYWTRWFTACSRSLTRSAHSTTCPWANIPRTERRTGPLFAGPRPTG